MRHCSWLLLVAVLAAQSLLPALAGAEIRRVPWRQDPAWSAVLAEAGADSGRSILIHFHAPWCGPCRLLDAMVYNESEVVDALADVVTVKIDIYRPANTEMRGRFVIERLPTLVWCAPDGQEVNRFVG